MVLELIVAFLTGMFVKFVAGLDDAATNAPVVANYARSHRGRVAYGIGMLIATFVIIGATYAIAEFLGAIPFRQAIFAAILAALAVAIYFDVGIHNPRISTVHALEKYQKQKISSIHFSKLAVLGFATFFATVIDDVLVYMSVLGDPATRSYVLAGIFVAALAEIWIVLHAAKRIASMRYKKELAVISLLILAVIIIVS